MITRVASKANLDARRRLPFQGEHIRTRRASSRLRNTTHVTVKAGRVDPAIGTAEVECSPEKNGSVQTGRARKPNTPERRCNGSGREDAAEEVMTKYVKLPCIEKA